MSDDTAAIKAFARSRPVRVAYLVEDGEHSHAVLDAIVADCHRRWGGRFSPIVPCASGLPLASFMPWLEAYDPDVLYSYSDLGEEAERTLREQFGPAFLLKHDPPDFGERDAHFFRPELPFAMLSSLSTAVQYARAFPASSPQPILVPDYLPSQEPDRFVSDNFGAPSLSFFRWPLPENLADVVKPMTIASPEALERFFQGRPRTLEAVADASALLREMARRRNTFGLAQLAADSAPKAEVRRTHQDSFILVIGDTFADRVLFWNIRGSFPTHLGRGVVSLIIPQTRFGDGDFFEALVEFLKARNDVHGSNRTPWVKLVSASIERPLLEALQARLQASDTWNSYNAVEFLTVEASVPDADSLRDGHVLACVRGFDRQPSWTELRVTGSRLHAPTPVPAHIAGAQIPAAATDGLWAVDVDVQRQNNLSRYSNVTHRWHLPLRLRMHGAFRQAWTPDRIGADIRYSRSSRDGFVVVFASVNEEAPELTLPNDESVFKYALERGHDWPPLSRRSAGSALRPTGPFAFVRPSDKGRYLTGTLRLFGGLQDARAFLLHTYWKRALEELGGGAGGTRHDDIKRVLKRRVREGRIESEEAWDRLATFVAQEAHRVRVPLRKLSFEELRARYEPFLERERQRLGTESASADSHLLSLQKTLSHSVRALCARSILYQGYEWRCQTCFHSNWNPIDSLSRMPSCEVCGEAQVAPVDQPWDFRLNGFIRDGLKEHGLLALIWCLVEMEGRAKDSFFFLGPHELYLEYPEESRSGPWSEADLLCIVDRKVHLCEVKTSDRDIDLASLVATANRLRPDFVTLAVMHERTPRVEAKLSELEQALASTGIAPELMTLGANALEDGPYLAS